MHEPPPPIREPNLQAKVSLASMLFATAAVAELIAATLTAIRTVEIDELAPTLVGGTLVGVFAAAIVLGSARRAWFEILAGLFAGAAFGAIAGALIVAPRAFPAVAIGSLVLVLFALLVRLATPRERGTGEQHGGPMANDQ